MATKKRAKQRQHPLGDAPDGRTYYYEFKVSERKVAVTGTPIKVKGRRGEYIFLKHVVRDDGEEWIDTLGPNGTGFRTIRPHEIARLAPVRRGRR